MGQVCGFYRILRFSPPIYITEILLYTRHRTKTNKTIATQKNKTMHNTDPTKNRAWTHALAKVELSLSKHQEGSTSILFPFCGRFLLSKVFSFYVSMVILYLSGWLIPYTFLLSVTVHICDSVWCLFKKKQICLDFLLFLKICNA
jgi:hypothetical protein